MGYPLNFIRQVDGAITFWVLASEGFYHILEEWSYMYLKELSNVIVHVKAWRSNKRLDLDDGIWFRLHLGKGFYFNYETAHTRTGPCTHP